MGTIVFFAAVVLALGMVMFEDARVFSTSDLPCDVRCTVVGDSVSVTVTVDGTLVNGSSQIANWANWKAQPPYDEKPVNRVGSKRVQFSFRTPADSAWNRMLIWNGRERGLPGNGIAPSYRLYLAPCLRSLGLTPDFTELARRISQESASQPTDLDQRLFIMHAPGVADLSQEKGSDNITMTLVDGSSATVPSVAARGTNPSSRGQPELRTAITDAPSEFLLTSAAADFHAHRPPYPAQFRDVRIGYVVVAGGARQYLLRGDFLPADETGKPTGFHS